ncbi:hypothetical protein [uncultured Mucilaginibacter sp.]|uniref:hypothetical protein n=1 Tax=uncultured Mucilaginibacter sp. TaxID=797541 RepID=UPI00260D2534|nr:hypothetical protein [uncultured Mucilaginibacter sp.]
MKEWDVILGFAKFKRYPNKEIYILKFLKVLKKLLLKSPGLLLILVNILSAIAGVFYDVNLNLLQLAMSFCF